MTKPNIVMLLLDTATARSFSCYGNERKVTPFIDELAQEGVIYEKAFANSIYSLPSYTSVFTGLHPTEHGAIDWDFEGLENNPMIQGLNESGYHTIAVSNHLISNRYGFAQAFDTMDLVPKESGRPFPGDDLINEMDDGTAQEKWDSGKQKYLYFVKEAIKRRGWKSVANGAHDLWEKFKREKGWWSDQGAAKGIEMSKDIVKNTDQPFFLFLNFIEPHYAYRPPKDYIWKFMPEDVTFDEILRSLDKQLLNVSVGHEEVTERQKEILLRLHEAEINYVDDKIRELYNFFESEGIAENTVFVVLSDHGDMFGKKGIWGHRGRIYNQVSHVPLIINYPWKEEGKGEDGLVELKSLCDHLINIGEGKKETLPVSEEVLIEYYGLDTQQSFKPWEEFDDVEKDKWANYQAGLVKDGYKLIWDSNNKVELYNLEKDFDEEENIADSETDKVEELKQRILNKVGDPKDLHREYRKSKSASEEVEELDI